MLDNADLPVGGRSMQGRVALLILTRHFRAVVNEQRHNVQVACRNKAAENIVNLYRTIGQFIPPELSPSAFTAASILLSCL